MDPKGVDIRASGCLPPGKSQEAIGFLRNTGTDLPREAIGPPSRSNWTPWVQLLLKGGPYVYALRAGKNIKIYACFITLGSGTVAYKK